MTSDAVLQRPEHQEPDVPRELAISGVHVVDAEDLEIDNALDKIQDSPAENE